MFYRNNKFLAVLLLVMLVMALASCDKTTIQFGSDGIEGDPNISVIDSVTLTVSTLQLDSFSTNNTGYFVAGAHKDPELGAIESKSFFEVTTPKLDLRDCSNCRFDSVVFHTKLSGGFMGDTTVPFTLKLHELTQSINETDLSTGYNTSHVNYNSTALVSKQFSIRPGSQDSLSIKMGDDFGSNLFRMLRINSDTTSNADLFRLFFKGICLTGDNPDNAMYYFEADSSTYIRLHYTVAGATPTYKTADFYINNSYNRFNEFTYDKSGTNLSVFTPEKKELINSTSTNNIGYLHYNSGMFPKINLGNLLFLKELHPYIQVMKAELKVMPLKGTYGIGTNYSLPPSVELRQTDDDNYVTGTALTYGGSTQYGSLSIDNLYGVNTAYTYDVTDIVNTILSEGVFSRRALVMFPLQSNANTNDQRLLFYNSLAKEKGIQLKLYVLGL